MRRTTFAVLMFGFVSPATAGPILVDPYVATTSGVFTGSPVGGLTGMGTSRIVFGQGVGQSPPSAISFTGTALPAGTSGIMEIGQIAFFNGVISSTSLTPNPFSFALQLSLALANRPDGILSGSIALQQFASLNVSTRLGNADSLTITATDLPTFSFLHGDWEYTIQVLGFGQASGDGFGTSTKLTAYEWNNGGGLLTAPLLAMVTAVPIPAPYVDPEPETKPQPQPQPLETPTTFPIHNPEPATLAVLGLMALGGGVYARRRRVV